MTVILNIIQNDSRDAEKYNYQSDLYAATPITVNIPKN